MRFLNGLNKPCNSDLFDELVQVLAHKYDRDTLSITFPTFVKDLQNCHPELQMISSNRLQKIKLIYSHNIVTKSLATIFVHTSIKAHYKFENEGDPEIHDMVYDRASELGSKLERLFRDQLAFEEVESFLDLDKS